MGGSRQAQHPIQMSVRLRRTALVEGVLEGPLNLEGEESLGSMLIVIVMIKVACDYMDAFMPALTHKILCLHSC